MLQNPLSYFVFLVVMTTFSGADAAVNTDEYEISGTSIHTKLNQGVMEDAVYVAFASLPSENTLIIPYYFTGDPGTTVLEASFDGTNLDVLAGYPLEPDIVGVLILDISSVQSQTGELNLALSSTSDTEAELILMESLTVIAASGDNDQTADTTQPGDTAGDGGGGSFDQLLLLLIFMATMVRSVYLSKQMNAKHNL